MAKKRDYVFGKWVCVSVSFLTLIACISSRSSTEIETVFPVYFDPRYFYQIPTSDFPFHAGDLVMLQGIMVYHGKPKREDTLLLSHAQWSASIYPNGEMLAEETLAVQLQKVNNQEETYEVQWQIDNDTRLLAMSDRSLPPELFPSPHIGDTAVVCVALEITKSNPEQPFMVLIPSGKLIDKLILSEVKRCRP